MDRKVFNGKVYLFVMIALAVLFIVTNIMQVYSISYDYGLAVSTGYYFSFIVSADGVFVLAVLLFSILALLCKCEKTNILKIFMWAVLGANLYYGIPMLSSVTSVSADGSIISNVLLIMMVIPEIVLAVAVAAQLYSFGRCHKTQAAFSWISVYVSLFFFVFHVVYVITSLASLTSLYAVSGQLICVGLNGCLLFFSWFMLNVFKNEDNLNAFLVSRKNICAAEADDSICSVNEKSDADAEDTDAEAGSDSCAAESVKAETDGSTDYAGDKSDADVEDTASESGTDSDAADNE